MKKIKQNNLQPVFSVHSPRVVRVDVDGFPERALDDPRRPVDEPLELLRHDDHLFLLLAEFPDCVIAKF